MDEGREFAIEAFGPDGVHIRGRAAELVREIHNSMTDAQEASRQRSHGVYGEFWRGAFERFEEFAQLQHGLLKRPGQAPYKISVVNGTAIVPWRFGRTSEDDLGVTPFITSDARAAIFLLPNDHSQDELDLDIPRPELTDEEREFAAVVQSALNEVQANRVVVVAVSSSPHGLHKVMWGEVTGVVDDVLQWGFCENLMDVEASGPALISDGEQTFATGDLPEKVIRLNSDTEEEAADE